MHQQKNSEKDAKQDAEQLTQTNTISYNGNLLQNRIKIKSNQKSNEINVSDDIDQQVANRLQSSDPDLNLNSFHAQDNELFASDPNHSEKLIQIKPKKLGVDKLFNDN